MKKITRFLFTLLFIVFNFSKMILAEELKTLTVKTITVKNSLPQDVQFMVTYKDGEAFSTDSIEIGRLSSVQLTLNMKKNIFLYEIKPMIFKKGSLKFSYFIIVKNQAWLKNPSNLRIDLSYQQPFCQLTDGSDTINFTMLPSEACRGVAKLLSPAPGRVRNDTLKCLSDLNS
jgi:hypothetical protein